MELFNQIYDLFEYNINIDLFWIRNNLWLYLVISALILIICCFYVVLSFNDRVVDLSHTKVNQSSVKTVNDSNEFPPNYPNGWIPVLESTRIRINQIKNFIAFGHQLVAFRGGSGRVYVLDAFCPHLGANIGVGGRVVDECGHDCIRCPFHGWTFRGTDGLCVRVPQMDCSEIPNTRIKVWESIESNNIVFVWYHSKAQKPNWFPLPIQEIKNKKWVFEGRTEHIVNCHFQEIPENGADRAHIQELHSPGVMSGNVVDKSIFYDLLSKVLYHEWESKWWPSEGTDKHIAHMTLDNRNQLFGYTLMELNFTIRQIGPAFVELRFTTSAFGGIAGTFTQMLTPFEANRHRIVHHIYTEPTLKAKLLAKFLLYGELKMIERDIIIWNNKKFVKNPVFTKNEKSLVQFRRWFRQFYSDEDLKHKQW